MNKNDIQEKTSPFIPLLDICFLNFRFLIQLSSKLYNVKFQQVQFKVASAKMLFIDVSHGSMRIWTSVSSVISTNITDLEGQINRHDRQFLFEMVKIFFLNMNQTSKTQKPVKWEQWMKKTRTLDGRNTIYFWPNMQYTSICCCCCIFFKSKKGKTFFLCFFMSELLIQ